jgi:Thermostable hemolysin
MFDAAFHAPVPPSDGLSALPAAFPATLPMPLSELRWQVHPPGAPGRAEVEAFVQAVYARRHGARVRQFAPTLVSLDDATGPVAAAGYRRAGPTPLFLERYLDAPIEASIAAQTGEAPARGSIIEVGHLAASREGAGRRMIHHLGPHLAALGCSWVVGTLTEELRALFVRLGITPLTLAAADPARLGDARDQADWGRYYEHRPMVLAGHLPRALQRLETRRRRT